MSRLSWSTLGATLAAPCFAAACAAVWGFEPGDAPGAGLSGSGGAGQGAGGSAGDGGALGGAGAAAGAGGAAFVQHQEGSIDLSWDFGGATGFSST